CPSRKEVAAGVRDRTESEMNSGLFGPCRLSSLSGLFGLSCLADKKDQTDKMDQRDRLDQTTR
ncbi:MAG: hypothetical protein OEU87_10470, partial [Nitrospira sp.]|nr:hypothetical protein [Nitrospira sp.]